MPLVLSGSLDISGSLTVTQNVVFQQTGSLQTTASWAEYVVNGGSSVLAVTGSTIYSVNPATSNVNPNLGIFLGLTAGEYAPNTEQSVFIGQAAGFNALNAKYSNFLGVSAGDTAYHASGSNFFGFSAGAAAINAAYSNIIGYKAGYSDGIPSSIGRNNVVIGTSVTLAPGRRDSINIGGLLFGTGSYFDVDVVSSGSANGKIGVNQPLPQYSLDVSGSIGLTDLFVLASKDTLPVSNVPSGSIMASGSGANFKPYFWNGATWASMV